MHIQTLTKRLPVLAETKALDRDIAFVSMIIDFALLVQEAVGAIFKGE